MRVAALVPDLLFGSRVQAMLERAGHHVVLISSAEEIADADVVVVDLTVLAPEHVPTGGAPVLGFYAHVEPEIRARAQACGFAQVVPRSRFAREGAALVGALGQRSA